MDEYNKGAEDGWADRKASFHYFFRHLLSLSETLRFKWKQHPGQWSIDCEGWSYSEYEIAYLVAFLGGNPHGLS